MVLFFSKFWSGPSTSSCSFVGAKCSKGLGWSPPLVSAPLGMSCLFFACLCFSVRLCHQVRASWAVAKLQVEGSPTVAILWPSREQVPTSEATGGSLQCRGSPQPNRAGFHRCWCVREVRNRTTGLLMWTGEAGSLSVGRRVQTLPSTPLPSPGALPAGPVPTAQGTCQGLGEG